MLKGSAIYGTTFIGESSYTKHEYYHLSRSRSQAAETVLRGVASVVSAVMVTRGVQHDELFDRYDVKLWSYDDSLVRFAVSTIPTVAVLAAVFVAYRGVEMLRSAFSL